MDTLGNLLKKPALLGTVLLGTVALFAAAAEAAPALLDPTGIQKFVTPLFVPPVMPKAAAPNGATYDYYEIALRQFNQQILPAGLPQTPVWGYGAAAVPGSFHSPSATIEAKVGTPVRVKWINDLKDQVSGNFLPHLLPVDQTLHWANPPKDCLDGAAKSDCRGKSQLPYTGPVPMIPHLHGAHVGPESDGYPEAWFLPAAADIPVGYATTGTRFGQIANVPVAAGEAVFEYPNSQEPATLWYHDHTLGMTRVNVYAGTAGFYLLRGGKGEIPTGDLPAGPYEIPLAIQDKSFKPDGSLFFPDNRAFFEGLNAAGDTPPVLDIPFIPEQASGGASDVPPIWNPEFFGNTIVVNGNTWPYLDVEPRRYRLRFLNGSNSRFLILKNDNGLPFWQIGGDGSYLKKPVALKQLLIAPAERADVIVDFTGIASNTTITLLNLGPDEPFGGGTPGVDFASADPATTGKVMQFRVVLPLTGKDLTKKAKSLNPRNPPSLPHRTGVRRLSLNELESPTVLVTTAEDGSVFFDPNNPLAVPFGPTEGRLGTFDKKTGTPTAIPYMDAITENPALGATEVWEFYNFTADAHPIHLHLVQFEVLERQKLAIDPATGAPKIPAKLKGNPIKRKAWETGRKDTVVSYPGQVTRIKVNFDIPGLYVWHCHIIDHEDNDMMRPYFVGPMP